ncbi:carbohydrate-binding protein [Microbulbifer agarilyticus]
MSLFLLCMVGSVAVAVEPLSVQGNQVLIGGKPGSLSGNSLFHSNNGFGAEQFYSADVVSWLKSDWQADVVRAAMGVELPGGYLDDPAANEARVRTVVEAAIANDMYVIINWHSSRANEIDWGIAIDFFTRMARDYGHTNNVIYGIFNEPLQVTWSDDVKPYAEAVITSIRDVDPDNLIVVGTPRWSQDVDEVSFDPITNHINIAYSLHFSAGSHRQFLRDKAQAALSNGIALFVTDWRAVDGSGDGPVDHASVGEWMNFLQKNKISHVNWAFNNKQESTSALLPGSEYIPGVGFPESTLTESGILARHYIRKTVAERCVVTVPARIEAESYCEMSGTVIEPTVDTGGGSNLGFLDPGDWMRYRIDVPFASHYDIVYRIASAHSGGALQLHTEHSGVQPGVLAFPNTGSWQAWTFASQSVYLEAGEQNIVLEVIQPGWNLNWLEILPNGDPPPPVHIEAEAYTYMGGVQTESTTDVGGGLNVGWIDTGDWMAFHSIDIPGSGMYRVEFRVAAQASGGRLSFERAGGSPVFTVLDIPQTGGWQNWTTISADVYLQAGQQNFGIGVPAGGWNLNWINITKLP